MVMSKVKFISKNRKENSESSCVFSQQIIISLRIY